MKIARTLPVSGRHDEWHPPLPAPSLRELSSECETEGVYFDERNPPFVGAMKIARHPHGFASTRLNGKTSPHTKSKNHPPADKTSSGRVIDVMGGTFPGSLREGAGVGLYHSTGCSLISGVTGDFHRPYETLIFLPVTFIGRHSLSHARWACQLPQRGSRGRAVPFNRVLAKPWGFGRFSSPLRKSVIEI